MVSVAVSLRLRDSPAVGVCVRLVRVPVSTSGDSLCYAFIGFDTEAACEEAYFKMNNVLVDDRRIKACNAVQMCDAE